MKIILIKYGEIILKGLNRPIFENKLMTNIRRASFGEKVKIWKAQATIYVEPKTEDCDMDALAKRYTEIFGVVSVTVAHVVEKDIEKIKTLSVELASKCEGKTFKVNSKRADKRFPYTSPEIGAMVGEAVYEAYPDLEVSMREPEFLITVEVRDLAAYVYSDADKMSGVGGLPTGTGGKAALLLSGGIDSPVAGYMMAKRGVELCAIHFYSYPYTSERAKQKVLDLAKIVSKYTGELKVYVVPFTEIQLEINAKCPEEQMTVIMRRIMMYISDKVARRHNCKALVTGESLGQVASQTMDALAVTDNASTMPVFRPLIGMDKEEIVTISRKIGAFETSILPYEDCCTVFTPKHPNTKPKLDKILESESALAVDELVERAIDGIEEVVCRFYE